MKGIFPLPALLLFFLLQKTAIGTDAIQVTISPKGLCVAPGDAIELVCHVKSAPNEQTRVSFYKGSMPIDEVVNHNTLCRPNGTECRSWDLSAHFSVGVASERDGGVYLCRAEGDGITYGNASATVFVQHQSEFYLPDDVTVMAANLGDKVMVPLTRECDMKAPIQVTRTGEDGKTEVIPYAYSLDEYQSAYVDRVEGKLVIPDFSCTDVANYTFTITVGRGYEPVSTAKFIYITLNDSCKGCCQEHVTSTPKTNSPAGRKPIAATVTASPNQILGDVGDNTVYVVIIVILVVVVFSLVASHVGVYWRRRQRRRAQWFL